jgi:ABC-2 type transport system permease protein
MPVVFRVLSYFVPASYFINITRGIILRGATLRHLWLDGLALFAIGAFLLVIAARRFRRKVIMA